MTEAEYFSGALVALAHIASAAPAGARGRLLVALAHHLDEWARKEMGKDYDLCMESARIVSAKRGSVTMEELL